MIEVMTTAGKERANRKPGPTREQTGLGTGHSSYQESAFSSELAYVFSEGTRLRAETASAHGGKQSFLDSAKLRTTSWCHTLVGAFVVCRFLLKTMCMLLARSLPQAGDCRAASS